MSDEHPLRKWRHRRGVKLIDLADQAEIPKGYMSEIETGKKTPSLRVIMRLSDITGIPIRKIAEYAGTPA